MKTETHESSYCRTGCFDTARLTARIQSTYNRLAQDPQSQFHFNVGMAYAVRELGYDPEALARVPAAASSRFAGVGNPFRAGYLARGATILDHACGAGTDLLLAANAVGREGRAIGVDITAALRECARAAAREAGMDDRVDIREGSFEALPVDDESIDVVISNGVVNLAPDKHRVFQEIYRVLKPGGALYLADVVTGRALAPSVRGDPDLWAACIGGALTAAELHALAEEAGLVAGEIVERYACFRGTPLELKLGAGLDVHGVSFRARKEVHGARHSLRAAC